MITISPGFRPDAAPWKAHDYGYRHGALQFESPQLSLLKINVELVTFAEKPVSRPITAPHHQCPAMSRGLRSILAHRFCRPRGGAAPTKAHGKACDDHGCHPRRVTVEDKHGGNVCLLASFDRISWRVLDGHHHRHSSKESSKHDRPKSPPSTSQENEPRHHQGGSSGKTSFVQSEKKEPSSEGPSAGQRRRGYRRDSIWSTIMQSNPTGCSRADLRNCILLTPPKFPPNEYRGGTARILHKVEDA